jgi:katanin p80 WD40 repeat-containing subunit B1
VAGLSVLRLILKNFGNVIKSNIEGPIQTVGVDISREERFVKLFFVFLLVVIFLVYVFRLVLDNFTGKCGL